MSLRSKSQIRRGQSGARKDGPGEHHPDCGAVGGGGSGDKGKTTGPGRNPGVPIIPMPAHYEKLDKGHRHVARVHVGRGKTVETGYPEREPVLLPSQENEHVFTASAGKHSVNINVKIKKNGHGGSEHTSSSVHQSPTGAGAGAGVRTRRRSGSPIPTMATSNFKKGSWAELLHRPTANQLDDVLDYNKQSNNKRRSRDKERHVHHQRRELSPIPMSTGSGDGDHINFTLKPPTTTAPHHPTDPRGHDEIIRDYADTIKQLYELSTNLRSELTEANEAKDKLLSQLREVIKENEQLRNNSVQWVAELRETVQKVTRERDEIKASHEVLAKDLAEHNTILHGILNAIGNVKTAVNDEIETMKDDLATPLSPFPSLPVIKSKLGSDASSVNLYSSDESSSIMSDVSFFDRDQSSTQYLNLPKGVEAGGKGTGNQNEKANINRPVSKK